MSDSVLRKLIVYGARPIDGNARDVLSYKNKKTANTKPKHRCNICGCDFVGTVSLHRQSNQHIKKCADKNILIKTKQR